MTHPSRQLHCTACHQGNPWDARFCQNCQTPLVHRYLRLLGRSLPADQMETRIGDRYWVLGPQWVLDLHPELLPTMPETIPAQLLPYLHLIPQRLHLPQVYGQLPEQPEETWLLEFPPLLSVEPPLTIEQLELPSLAQVWAAADGYRQIFWLWQVARLWMPLATETVVSSLWQPELLRVQGSLVQLQALQPDEGSVSLRQLGRAWQGYLTTAHPVIRPFLTGLVQQLQSGAIAAPEQLVQLLDGALANLASLRDRTYQLVAATDTGPSRDHNEDACYPQTRTPMTGANLLAIVCDGIGGHEGGEVASGMAIAQLQTGLQDLLAHLETPPEQILPTLEQSILAANQQLCDQNDQEQREERQRMGTTLVTTVLTPELLYYAHVGDSRLYWITRQGCHRLTLDDDVAAREVRLGYALERDALSFPGGGSLVQALGMGPRLYPNLERWALDEDSILLICSDGLSDRDRVEQYWPSELVPVLNGERTIAEALQRLIEMANRQNGHDNITVALVQVQVQNRDRPLSPLAAPPLPHTTASQPVRRAPAAGRWFKTLGVLLLLLTGLTLLSYRLFPEWRNQVDRLLGNAPVTSPEPPLPSPDVSPFPSPDPTSPLPSPELTPLPEFAVGQTVQLPAGIDLYPDADIQSTPTPTPTPSLFTVIERVERVNEQPWLQLQRCDPNASPPRVWVPVAQAQRSARLAPEADCAVSLENLVE
ncbi:MAG: protein phosphatase 2C domain-containing protein [Cyanobacteria bacterium P01_G01_bin.54]